MIESQLTVSLPHSGSRFPLFASHGPCRRSTVSIQRLPMASHSHLSFWLSVPAHRQDEETQDLSLVIAGALPGFASLTSCWIYPCSLGCQRTKLACVVGAHCCLLITCFPVSYYRIHIVLCVGRAHPFPLSAMWCKQHRASGDPQFLWGLLSCILARDLCVTCVISVFNTSSTGLNSQWTITLTVSLTVTS